MKTVSERIWEIGKKNPVGFTAIVRGNRVKRVSSPTKDGRYVVSITNNDTLQKIGKLMSEIDTRVYIFDEKNPIIVGGWTSPDGTFYLDKNVIVRSLDEALELGRKFKQHSIFDLKTKQTIEVK